MLSGGGQWSRKNGGIDRERDSTRKRSRRNSSLGSYTLAYSPSTFIPPPPPSTPSYFWDWILTSTESSISGNDLGKGSCQAAVSEESIVSFDLIASHSPASFVPSPPRLPSVPSNSVRNCIIRYVNRFVFFSPPDTSNFFSFSKQNDLYRSRFQLRRFEVREKSTFCQFFLFVFI